MFFESPGIFKKKVPKPGFHPPKCSDLIDKGCNLNIKICETSQVIFVSSTFGAGAIGDSGSQSVWMAGHCSSASVKNVKFSSGT